MKHTKGPANAKLIETAPELLDACKDAVYQISRIEIDGYNLEPGVKERLYLAFVGIRQAIAKAEGNE